MNPEERHLEFLARKQKGIVKTAHAMARVRYTIFRHISQALNFKVYIQIWQDDDWNYEEFLEFCKKLTADQIELNTSRYKAIADELYLLISAEMPSRNIWICINHNDIGITIKYEQ